MKSINDAPARAGHKLRSQSGLTMVELLVTIFLIGIAGAIITATVDQASRQFRLRSQDSDAQMLCSSLSLFVQNELTYAGDISTSGGLTFTDHVHGLGKGCSFAINGDGRMVLSYGTGKVYEAVGAGTYKGSKKLRAELTHLDYAGGTANVTISVYGKVDGEEKCLAENVFTVRPIAPGVA